MGFPVYIEPHCYDGQPAAQRKKASSNKKRKNKPDYIEVTYEDIAKMFRRIWKIAYGNGGRAFAIFFAIIGLMHFLNKKT